jgi:alpha 1,2-mannosyltransferase
MEYVLCPLGSSFFGASDDCAVFTLSIRPDVRFFCDLNFDPFLLMQDQNKVYGMFDAPISCMEEGR